MMDDARETLARVAEGAPGWTLDADSHARFATLAHPDGAVVELRRERDGEPWACDAGRPGRMQRRQAMAAAGAVLVATVAADPHAPELESVAGAAWRMVHAENGTSPGTPARVVMPLGEPWKPEPCEPRKPEPPPDNRARVDAILASLPANTGPAAVSLREGILADEVRRLRAQWADLRAKVATAQDEAEGAPRNGTIAARQWHGAQDEAFRAVLGWMDAGGEGGGA